MDNDSHKNKNNEYQEDVNMAAANSQIDDDLVEASYVSNTERDKKSCSELDVDNYSQMNTEGRKGDNRKRKAVKKGRYNMEKLKKTNKRSAEDYHPSNLRKEHESIAEFTKYRSMKMTKERDDIIESRNLGVKVSLF